MTNSHIVLYNFPHTITDSMLLVNIDMLKYCPSRSHYYIVIVSKLFIPNNIKNNLISNHVLFIIRNGLAVKQLLWKAVTIGLYIFHVNQAMMNLCHGYVY